MSAIVTKISPPPSESSSSGAAPGTAPGTAPAGDGGATQTTRPSAAQHQPAQRDEGSSAVKSSGKASDNLKNSPGAEKPKAPHGHGVVNGQRVFSESDCDTSGQRIASPQQSSATSDPLPPSLLSILNEIAETGASTSLLWNSATTIAESKTTESSAVPEARGSPRNGLHGRNRKRPLPGEDSGVKDEASHIALPYQSLKEAFRRAVELVLNHGFKYFGGYHLSKVESARHTGPSNQSVSAEEIFQLRKQRLLDMFDPSPGGAQAFAMGPPFTIQRIAEVLVNPRKYYTQTHKLCNCLEKLLLVTSPISAFGGSRGGETSQSRREDEEIVALAHERERIQTELKRQRKRRRSVSAMPDADMSGVSAAVDVGPVSGMTMEGRKNKEGGEDLDDGVDAEVEEATETTEAERELEAARASLRTKFDHVGLDPHHNHGAVVGAAAATAMAMAEGRSLTNSPPPPALTIASPNHLPHVRHSEHSPTSPVRSPSPLLFSEMVGSPPTPPNLHVGAAAAAAASNSPTLPSPNPSLHLLQMNHVAAVAGVSPFDLITNTLGAGIPATGTTGTLAGPSLNGMKEMDVESRSSASSDDFSESDEGTFDDSASDGSDSGFLEHAGNALLSRAMAWKQRQQQRVAPRAPSSTLGASNSGTPFFASSNTGTSTGHVEQQPHPQQNPHPPKSDTTRDDSGKSNS